MLIILTVLVTVIICLIINRLGENADTAVTKMLTFCEREMTDDAIGLCLIRTSCSDV
jgi:hypothetical protein